MQKYKKDHIKNLLKNHTASQIAKKLGVTKKSIQTFMDRKGLSSLEIKKEYAKQKLRGMNNIKSIDEMVKLTGFSRRKVLRLLKEFGYKSKFKQGHKK